MKMQIAETNHIELLGSVRNCLYTEGRSSLTFLDLPALATL